MAFAYLIGSINNYDLYSGEKRTLSGRQAYILIVCIMFSIIMSFRATTVGVDTSTYSRIFSIIGNSSSFIDSINNAPLTAPIYVLLCRILSLVSSEPQILVIVSSILVNIGLFLFISRVSIDPTMSVFAWFGLALFFTSMNGNRQTLAIVLCLNALYHLAKNKKSLRGWFLFSISVGIHPTSMIILLAFFGMFISDHFKNSRKVLIISSILSVGIALGYAVGVKFLVQFFPRYLMYLSGESTYSIFIGTGSGRIIILYIFLYGIICLWVFKNSSNILEDDLFSRRMLPAVIFGSIFGIMNSQNELINRMLWFYLAIFVSFIPSTIGKYRKPERIIIKYGIICVLTVYCILSLVENQNGVLPYVFFWS